MKSIRTTCQYLHRYSGWLGGIVFLFFCVTGIILLVQPEVERATEPGRFTVAARAGEEPLTPGEFIAKFEALEESTFEEPTTVRVRRLQRSSNPRDTWRVVASAQNSRQTWSYLAYADPYDGKGVAYGPTKLSPKFLKVRSLHTSLLASSRKTGTAITGYASLVVAIVLITGLVRWIPRQWKNRKALANSFWPTLNRGGFRANFSLHNALGFYSALMSLLLALTGAYIALDWFRADVNKLAGVESAASASAQGGKQGGQRPETKGEKPSGREGSKSGGAAASERGGAPDKGAEKEPEVPASPTAYGSGILARRSPETGGVSHHDQSAISRSTTFVCEEVLEETVGVDAICAAQKELVPGFKGLDIVIPEPGTNRAVVVSSYGSFSGFWKPDAYYWDPYTGKNLGKTTFSDTPREQAIMGLAKSFHQGKIYSSASRYVLLVFSVFGVILATTGYVLTGYRHLLMAKRRRKAGKGSAETDSTDGAGSLASESGVDASAE